MSEGLLLRLDPAIDIVTRAAPYFVRYRSWDSVEQVMGYGYNTGEKAGNGTRLQATNPNASDAETGA